MSIRNRSAAVMLAAIGALSVLQVSAPVMAAAPKASAPARDVVALESLLRAAIQNAEAGFRPGESEADKAAAVQAAINGVLSAGTYDAVTAAAALRSFSGTSTHPTPAQQAANAVLATVGPAAQQETAEAASTSASSNAGSTGGSFSAASGGAAAGGGGYLIGH